MKEFLEKNSRVSPNQTAVQREEGHFVYDVSPSGEHIHKQVNVHLLEKDPSTLYREWKLIFVN